MVPMAGVEPARLTPLPPQDSVSTNSTTSAKSINLLVRQQAHPLEHHQELPPLLAHQQQEPVPV